MKKKLMAALTAVALLLPTVPVVKNAEAAKAFQNITFNDFAVGAVPNNITCNSKGNKIEVAAVPSESEKSLKINTLTAGSDAHIDFSLKSAATGQVVLETSVRVESLNNAKMKVFYVTDSDGASCTFLTVNKNGEVTLGDGTHVFYAEPGTFYDLAILMDFDKETFRVMVKGSTVMYDCPLDKYKLKNVKAVRIHLTETVESATAYVKHLRVYNADRILTPEEYQSNTVSPQPVARPKLQVTDALVKTEFANDIVMYLGAKKALVNGEVKVIDDENDAKAFISNSTTMVPLRFLSEALGATVVYEGENAYISMSNEVIVVKEGQDTYTINGELKPLPEPPVIVNSRLYVPLRVISESFGKEVFWDKTGIVVVGDKADGYEMIGDGGRLFYYVVSSLIYERPDADVIRYDAEETAATHPRLLVTHESVEEIKSRISANANMASWLEKIKTQADKYLDAAPLKYGLTDGVRMLATSKEALARIKTLGFIYLVTNEDKYANKAKDELLNVCSDAFPDWHPWHFLDCAEMSAAAAIGFDWLYNKLSDTEKTQVIDSIYKKGLLEVMKDYNQDSDLNRSYNWSKAVTNWQAVANGGLCMAALSILGEAEYDDIAYSVIENGLNRIEKTLGNYFPDGTWYEGQTYWQYMAQYMTYYIASLESALGTSYGLSLTPGYARGSYFVISYDGPNGVMNLNNSTAGAANSPQIFYMAKVLDDPTVAGHRAARLGNTFTPSVEDLIWYDPNFSKEGKGLTDGYFRGGQDIIVMRDGFDKTGTYAAIHGSEQNPEHLDSGTYIIDMLGERWILDPGTETQSYYDANHWQYYKVRAEGHNCVVVNPDGGWDLDPYAPVAIEKYESSSNVSFAILDLTEAYAYKGVTKARRGLMMNKGERTVVVRDEFEGEEGMEFYSFMHTEADITLTEDKKGAILALEGKKIYASLDGDDDLVFEVMAAKSLETSPQPTKGDSTAHLRKLAIHAEDMTKFTAQVTFSPLCADETEPSFTFDDIPLSSWSIPKKTKEAPKLDYLKFGGKLIEGFSPDKTVYEITTKRSLAYAPIEAGGNGDITIVQSNGENLISRIDIRDKEDSSVKRSYYINFMFTPEFVGVPDDMKEIKVKFVEASYVPQPENHAQNTIDDDFDSRWASDMLGSYIDYDLGSVQDICFVALAFVNGNARKEMFAIAISENGEDWEEVYNGKNSGTTTNIEGYFIGDRKARFVRVYAYGNALNNWFSMSEFKAYQKN